VDENWKAVSSLAHPSGFSAGAAPERASYKNGPFRAMEGSDATAEVSILFCPVVDSERRDALFPGKVTFLLNK